MQNNSLKYISDFDDVLRFIETRKSKGVQDQVKKEEMPFLYEDTSAVETADEETSDQQRFAEESLDKETYHKETSGEENYDEETLEKEPFEEQISDAETPDEETPDEETSDKDISEAEISDEETLDEEPFEEQISDAETSDEETLNKEISDKETSDEETLSRNEENITEDLKPYENRTADIETAFVEEKSETSFNDGSGNKVSLFEKKSVKKILLVEADMVLRKSIYYSLSEEGFYVVEADNGMDAIKKVQSEHFDQIVMYFQMQMPGGMDLIHLLRKELGLSTPVIILTSSGEKDADLESFTLVAN